MQARAYSCKTETILNAQSRRNFRIRRSRSFVVKLIRKYRKPFFFKGNNASAQDA